VKTQQEMTTSQEKALQEAIRKIEKILCKKKPDSTPERHKRSEILLFDIDGVITTPGDEKPHAGVLENLSRLYENGFHIHFVTGRPATWALSHIMLPLIKALPHKEFFNGTVLAAENGSVVVECKKGKLELTINPHACVEQSIMKAVEEYARQNTYLHHFPEQERENFQGSLIFDKRKISMATIYVEPKLPAPQRKKLREYMAGRPGQKILSDLEQICRSPYLAVRRTTIAFDVQHIAATKTLGSSLALQNYDPLRGNQVYTFGDSTGDLDMAVYASGRGFSVEHVHVGSEGILNPSPRIKLHSSRRGRFAVSTEAFLKKMK
jgi:HAD superfamily hydrolase (TIGR01484 family)